MKESLREKEKETTDVSKAETKVTFYKEKLAVEKLSAAGLKVKAESLQEKLSKVEKENVTMF